MCISFRNSKIPFRIRPSFFLVAAFLGGVGSSADLGVLLSWVLVVFVSVTLHELGHAGMGLAFGLEPSVELHGMGGTTSWKTARSLSTAQRVAISLAGPCAGFAVAAIVRWGLGPHMFSSPPVGRVLYGELPVLNFGGGVLNLLPVPALGGGN